MRLALFYNPFLLAERLGVAAEQKRRRRKLKRTPARDLEIGHIDSLELLELLRSNPPSVIYDVGASVGTWTLLARAIFPKAEIHAFEPLPSQRKGFGAATDGIPGIHLHPVALGSVEEESMMNVTGFSDGSSLLRPTQASRRDFGVDTVGQEKVSVSKLDDYVVKNGLPSPDLLKLDVQGYELEVLGGARNCLSQVRALILEASFQEYYAGQPLFHDLVSFCADSSLFIAALGKGTVLGLPLKQADVLFLKRTAVELQTQ